jgi:U3 small nucleolar RNA-associated protein 18
VRVSLAADPRLRKLRDAPGEDALGGREYERRLRRQFERLHPAPAWAAAKRKRPAPDAPSDEDEEDVLASTALAAPRTPGVLAPGTLRIVRARDANLAARAQGAVTAVRFHPSVAVPLLAVASADRRVRFFHVDGAANALVQTLHVPELPLTRLAWHPAGRSVLLTGPRPFWHTYDVATGRASRSPRGLWGAGDERAHSMEVAAFSPDGDVLAVGGRAGAVALVDWRAGGAQVAGTLKMSAPVQALWWARGGEPELLGLAPDGEVCVWDVRARRCLRRWKDEGAFGARVLAGDPGGRHLAIGCVSRAARSACPADDAGRRRGSSRSSARTPLRPARSRRRPNHARARRSATSRRRSARSRSAGTDSCSRSRRTRARTSSASCAPFSGCV